MKLCCCSLLPREEKTQVTEKLSNYNQGVAITVGYFVTAFPMP